MSAGKTISTLLDLFISIRWALVSIIKGPKFIYNFEIKKHGYTVRMITKRLELLKVFYGRYQAFQVEYLGRPRFGIDANRYDPNSYHFVCVGDAGAICGYYRATVGDRDSDFAYSDSMVFQNTSSTPKIVEASRAYVPKEKRGWSSIKALGALWSAVALLARVRGTGLVVGRGSIKCTREQMVSIQEYLRTSGYYRPDLQAGPKDPSLDLAGGSVTIDPVAIIPSLLRRYFKLGIKTCGSPALNPQLLCYDVFIVCDLDDPNCLID